MTKRKMTRTEEHDFYAEPENQTPQGPARRRKARLTEMGCATDRAAPDQDGRA